MNSWQQCPNCNRLNNISAVDDQHFFCPACNLVGHEDTFYMSAYNLLGKLHLNCDICGIEHNQGFDLCGNKIVCFDCIEKKLCNCNN